MLPKVSVIIPCFNSMPFLKETLESVMAQSYSHLEIIVIDDHSTDGSHEYLTTFSKDIIVRKNKGKGACTARNYGYELSRGDYIQYLDADDLLSHQKIEAQVEALRQHQAGIAVCNTMHFYDKIIDGKITDTDYLFTTDDPKSFLLNLYGANGFPNMVQTSAWLTPRNLVEKAGPWDENLSKDQDGEFFCRVVSHANQVIYVPNILNYYRKHISGQNIANQKRRIHVESQLKAVDSKVDQLKSLKHTKAYKAAFALQYKWIAIDAYPEFKDLSKKAWIASESLGGSNYSPVLGGAIIETIKSVFGWRTARVSSYWIHKIKS
ncbi:glycosyltransferase family 2 protein [Subsaxibacter sp. CAU 1640]|uniref:glycosyltransferase family 2 protein n=1 Tax=Subsaxibacter sp. CAU 1640 TaxID=2933271 RepID=UPI00293E279C|nr:glycosyltransferase family 2 protein [Subsaxibacter sp. CAU 1640]